MTHPITDITIIGGGPTGLFASFYTGMRAATAQIVDALPELGGQLTALYPEKYIFDVGGFAKILAKDLVKALKEGREPVLDRPLAATAEVELRLPALLPESYVADVPARSPAACLLPESTLPHDPPSYRCQVSPFFRYTLPSRPA